MTNDSGWTMPVCPGFSVHRRNYGHWDICDSNGRIFAIRGGPGKYYVRDERGIRSKKESGAERRWPEFKTLGILMAYVCEELMHENLSVQGKAPHAIESWNV